MKNCIFISVMCLSITFKHFVFTVYKHFPVYDGDVFLETVMYYIEIM